MGGFGSDLWAARLLALRRPVVVVDIREFNSKLPAALDAAGIEVRSDVEHRLTYNLVKCVISCLTPTMHQIHAIRKHILCNSSCFFACWLPS